MVDTRPPEGALDVVPGGQAASAVALPTPLQPARFDLPATPGS